ncbi:Syntaxin-6_N domain-containing protein [Cephalotus follicularis]|uniref:Syntaxin-6_N domain-containing protein n=1 Tax=Cephalotus follicularis TaxID=3775 RepID=A0A1Q3AVB5_CEPFO|nr:Syntaxin-6_N domain-containing protein [Cephalotus follicularis]
MMVANSFDLWQKDSFFCAAEEVQESADIMESAYRMWVRERRQGLQQEDLNKLSKELQTALGTAKWQLEEFERAVRMSHGYCREDNATARHRQFVAAIEDQISRVEAALRETCSEEGKQPLRWVTLDEEERDDLAMFLSGSFQSSPSRKDECIKFRPAKKFLLDDHHKKIDADLKSSATVDGDISSEIKGCRDLANTNKNTECVIDVDGRGPPETKNDITCQAERTTGTRRTWSSPIFGALRIVNPGKDEKRNKLMADGEATPKVRGFNFMFWKQRCGENPLAKVGGFHRQLQSPAHLQFRYSVRIILALMLTVFLIVPFVFYSP